MGSKVLNPNYKNMMVQNTQEKVSVNVKTSASNSSYKLLSSEVVTYNKNLNYRTYDASTNKFSTNSFVTSNPGELAPYRIEKQFVWKSAVDKDGTIKAADYQEYNWTASSQNPNWIKTSEATLYSMYSKVLEGLDIDNRKVSLKYSDKESYPIASVNNCDYGEWCFSGAEDLSYGTTWFGGEVSGGSQQNKSSSVSHTGNYSLKCPDGTSGFLFTGLYGTDIKPGKVYRATVWASSGSFLPPSNFDASLYITISTQPGQIIYSNSIGIASQVLQQYGNWYKMDLDITIPLASSLSGIPFSVSFGSRNPSSPGGSIVYFDDFRVHPIANAFDVNVTDIKTGNVIAILDKENIATKYFYDDSNKLIRSEKETKDGFKKFTEYSYHYKK